MKQIPPSHLQRLSSSMDITQKASSFFTDSIIENCVNFNRFPRDSISPVTSFDDSSSPQEPNSRHDQFPPSDTALAPLPPSGTESKFLSIRRKTDARLCSHNKNNSQQIHLQLSREERRKRRRATQKYRTAHATRERVRVEAFNVAFSDLRKLLPTLPPDKKLSKIEILKLAVCYISYLSHILDLRDDTWQHAVTFYQKLYADAGEK